MNITREYFSAKRNEPSISPSLSLSLSEMAIHIIHIFDRYVNFIPIKSHILRHIYFVSIEKYL